VERRPNRDCASDTQNDRGYELFCCLFHNQMIAGRVTSQKMVFQILSDEWERAETSVAFWEIRSRTCVGFSSSSFVQMW
jgi:hypothetical protein